MADKKKNSGKVKKDDNKKVVSKKSADKTAEVEKKLDKTFIIIAAIVVAIIIGVAVFLVVSGGDKTEDDPAQTTAPVQTTSAEALLEETLWEEHNALFDELKNVYWLGVYDNYKSLMPPAAWEALAADEELTVDELYAAIEEQFANTEPPENNDIRFYISKTTKLEGEELESVRSTFANMYSMETTDFQEIYKLDVQVVTVVDGERSSQDDVYYSVMVDGVRYLATDTGFVG